MPKGDLFGFVDQTEPERQQQSGWYADLCRRQKEPLRSMAWMPCCIRKEIKKQIGYVPDFFGVYDNLKVSEYMDFYGSMYRMTSREITAVSNDLLELVNLSDKKRGLCGYAFPRNEAAAVCGTGTHPQSFLLVLDEPNSGLDPRARVEMKELLQNLRSMGKPL